jgi:hypothetical protein
MKRIPQLATALAVAATFATGGVAYAADPCPGMSGSGSDYPTSSSTTGTSTTTSSTAATTSSTRHARRHHARRF